jgi:hypothetical protein
MGEDPVKSQTTRAYYNTFSSGDGAVVLGDLYRSFMDRCSHDEYDPDPQQTAFREGQRSVVIMIKALMAEGMLVKSETVDGVDLSTPTFTG